MIDALAKRKLISVFINSFDAILDPMYTKFLTFSTYLSSVLNVRGISVSWLRTLVFLVLMVRPKFERADETDSIVSADLGQSELRVQHNHQKVDHL